MCLSLSHTKQPWKQISLVSRGLSTFDTSLFSISTLSLLFIRPPKISYSHFRATITGEEEEEDETKGTPISTIATMTTTKRIAVARPMKKAAVVVGVVEPRVVVKIPWAKAGKNQDVDKEEKETGACSAEKRKTKSVIRSGRSAARRKRREEEEGENVEKMQNNYKRRKVVEEEEEGEGEEESTIYTETLPEHFRQALLKSLKRQEKNKKKERRKRKRGGESQESSAEATSPKCSNDNNKGKGGAKISPLKLVRKVVPGTDQEEYSRVDVVDLVDEEDGREEARAESMGMENYLKLRVPLLKVEKVGKKESAKPRVVLERLSEEEIQRHTADVSMTDHPFRPFDGMKGFGDLFSHDDVVVIGQTLTDRRLACKKKNNDDDNDKTGFRKYRSANICRNNKDIKKRLLPKIEDSVANGQQQSSSIVCENVNKEGLDRLASLMEKLSSADKGWGVSSDEEETRDAESTTTTATTTSSSSPPSSPNGDKKEEEEEGNQIHPCIQPKNPDNGSSILMGDKHGEKRGSDRSEDNVVGENNNNDTGNNNRDLMQDVVSSDSSDILSMPIIFADDDCDTDIGFDDAGGGNNNDDDDGGDFSNLLTFKTLDMQPLMETKDNNTSKSEDETTKTRDNNCASDDLDVDEDDIICLTPEMSNTRGRGGYGCGKPVGGRPRKYRKTIEQIEAESARRAARGHAASTEAPAAATGPKSPNPRASFTEEVETDGKWMYCTKADCNFWTRKPMRMHRHRLCHVAGEKTFACPDCGIRFHSLPKLLRHDRKVHTGDKVRKNKLGALLSLSSSRLIEIPSLQDYECKICEAEVTDIAVHMRVSFSALFFPKREEKNVLIDTPPAASSTLRNLILCKCRPA